MSELTVSQLIKITLGIIVVAAVLYGVYSFFQGDIKNIFQNPLKEETPTPQTQNPSQTTNPSQTQNQNQNQNIQVNLVPISLSP